MSAVAIGVAAALALATGAPAEPMPPLSAQQRAEQWQLYNADSVPSVLDLAPTRDSQEATAADGTLYRLTNLAPAVNRWFLVEAVAPDGSARSWHLESADAAAWQVSLTTGDAPALDISGPGGGSQCAPWAATGDAASALDTAAGSGLPFAPICAGKLYLRNRVSGSRSNREAVSDFLREHVIFGDKLVNLIKGTFFEDAFLETGEAEDGGEAGKVVAALGQAALDRRPLMRTGMELPVEGADGGMEAGSWYAVTGAEGVYASVMQPGMVAADILTQKNGARRLDGVENSADAYFAAFDLSRFELGYALGTDHPQLGWSSRPPRRGDDWRLPGPDGFNRPDPLVRNGMLNPSLLPRAAAAFAGGFKRDHGAFRAGPLAGTDRGHHYGFLTAGVTFSRLLPDLSTIYVTTDGTIGMKTWTEADNALIPDLAYARQNGVPLVERDPETGAPVPGGLVTSWGPGNWSGSAEAQLRTLRSGICLRQAGGRTFLIYGYFSAATPSGMARSFQAYGCDYAMQLDMNAPELTYLAVYRQNAGGDGLEAMHLGRYMEAADPQVHGVRVPRFVSFSDSRDFFYLLRKE